MFEKVSHSLIYWICLMVVSCILILWAFHCAYIGPEEEFWNHFGDVPLIVFSSGVVLGFFTEVLARVERNKRKIRETESNEAD